jgi:ubiquinone/menaquinone biosynthesis C-methylase UbiE
MKKDYANYILQENRKNYSLIARGFSLTRTYPWKETRFLFKKYLKPGDRVLDLGCGNGRYYPFFMEQKADYIGTDNSGELIKEAKKKYPQAEFITADALNLPFAENYFDAIFSVAVLHHIPSKELRLKFLQEARRALKPKGFLILTVWKPYRKKGRRLLLKYTILKLIGKTKLDFGDVFEPWGKSKVPLYRRHFSKREPVKLVRKAGFEIKEAGVIKNKKGDLQNIYIVAQK